MKLRTYIVIFIILFLLTNISAQTGKISYQGRLTDIDGSPLLDATYQITFLLYPDSNSGNILWAENADITTENGLINHIMGSINQINSRLFLNNESLYLELRIDGIPIVPRSLITGTAYSMTSENLKAVDSNGTLAYLTDIENHSLTIFDSLGEARIVLSGSGFDSSVILPDSAINSKEILNEPGITTSVDINLYPLPAGDMIDLVDVTITIPEKGYIVLYGKCYLLLSGTTGENTAIIQIDQNEGGGTQFPYYAIAGLSAYVNTGTNYFPIFVTRTYYKQKGTYTFRLEGRASNPLPAVAQSWDHVLTAAYFPTSYQGVEAIAPTTMGDPNAEKIIIDSNDPKRPGGTFYKIDFQNIEIIDKAVKKTGQNEN